MNWIKHARIVSFMFLLVACSDFSIAPQQATVTLISPVRGNAFKLGEKFRIQGEASGGVSEILILVNGKPLSQINVSANSPIVFAEWTPPEAGNHVIFLKGLDANKNTIAQSEVVTVIVEEPTPIPFPTPTTPPTPLLQPTLPAPTAPPTPAPTPTAGLTISTDFVNLRAGPGTAYRITNQMKRGDTATVLGKSEDGKWWKIAANENYAWVFGELVTANESANSAPIATELPPPTPLPIVATATALLITSPPFTPTPPPTTPPEEACDPSHPFWAAKLNNNPDYQFCTPVPFEYVGASDASQLSIRWHIFGIQSLELRVDGNSDRCDAGAGSRGHRQQVSFKEDAFQINRWDYPRGGYKISLWATLRDGRVQDWGELHFCNK
jgi:uncharacterized protein YraI